MLPVKGPGPQLPLQARLHYMLSLMRQMRLRCGSCTLSPSGHLVLCWPAVMTPVIPALETFLHRGQSLPCIACSVPLQRKFTTLCMFGVCRMAAGCSSRKRFAKQRKVTWSLTCTRQHLTLLVRVELCLCSAAPIL